MSIVGGLDLHRTQITFDYVESRTGEVRRGQIAPATRASFRSWLGKLAADDAAFAFEATTGWRFIAEELQAAGMRAHLADPAETHGRRSPKRRAKTDRSDARHLRVLLAQSELPESWIPPAHILDLRTKVRLRHTLVDQRGEWQQRIHAWLFHHGTARLESLLADKTRMAISKLDLPPVTSDSIATAYAMIDVISQQLCALDRELRTFADLQPGCRALTQLFGVGPFVASAIVAELGDCRRFSSARQAVRYAGLDVVVYESNDKRARGHLSHMGPEVLRWALYEAAQHAAKRTSPDHTYYRQVRTRIDHKRACLAVARKLCRRAHHTLVRLGDEAIASPSVVVPRAA